MMGIAEKIQKDHVKKSNQVKTLKRKLKQKCWTALPVGKLKEMLRREKGQTIDHRSYYSWGEFNDDAYGRDSARLEARAELLEELIRMVENKPAEKDRAREANNRRKERKKSRH